MRSYKSGYLVSAIATLFCTSHALAAVPAVVVDAQETIGSNNFIDPQQVVVAPNGIVYAADTSNNQVLQYIPNLPNQANASQVKVPGYSLSSPQGLAVDAAGDLYIADNSGHFGRILEVVANANGTLSNVVKVINSGGPLIQPLAMVIDSSNTLFVGDMGAKGNGDIYSIAPGKAPVALKTGVSSFTPGALARDSASDLYFVDSGSNNGGVYEMPVGGGTAAAVATAPFSVFQPNGVALDPAGDLFILAQVSGGGRGANLGQQVLEIPAAPSSAPYVIPSSNLQNLNGMTMDPQGNLDLVGVNTGFLNFFGYVTQLNFSNPVGLGAVRVSGIGNGVLFNFEFNAVNTLGGFRAVTIGDQGPRNSDVIDGSFGNCPKIPSNTSATQPYTCSQTFQATPQYTGMRESAIQVQGPKSSILSSTPVYETGLSAAQITYPLDSSTTALGLIEPQGITASGFDQTVYVADLANGAVYSLSGLNGSSPQAVSTGGIPLQAPSAVAMNGEGDLFIADFNLGEVVVVPTTTGQLPYVLNTGNLLQHPIALTLDFLGDLYIGDSGPDGDSATSSAPGYVVEVPYKGSAFMLPTPGVQVIFPEALAADSISGNLLIGDGGDASTGIGQIVSVPANGGNASVVVVTGATAPTDPSGLTFDAAENLYVLDGVANTITVVPPSGASYLLNFNGSALAAPSAMVSSAGSQSFVIANIGGGSSNNLVYLNGNSSTLAFGNQALNTQSQTMTATVANIGNQPMTLSKPNYYKLVNANAAFSILGSSTCSSGEMLTSSTTCSINVQFDPTFAGAQSEKLTISSNAYNSGTPVSTFNGTGTGTAQTAVVSKVVAQVKSSRGGRKSFKAARK
jgi:sugar lactone lactonase YvrE